MYLHTVHTNSWCSCDVPNKHHVSVTFQSMVEALGLFQVRNHTAGSSVFSRCCPNECINCLMNLNVLPVSVFAGYGSLAGAGYPGARPGEPWLRSYLLPSLSALILTLVLLSADTLLSCPSWLKTFSLIHFYIHTYLWMCISRGSTDQLWCNWIGFDAALSWVLLANTLKVLSVECV